ncbi:MAG: ABC transporter permease [Actinobacteria bacterium]|nr:ABC transporter permease [Actinomycetota bacterium]
MLARPMLIMPMLLMPLIFVISFTGAFGSLTRVEGYGTDNVFNWMAVYAALQGAVFAGVGGASATAEDIENGFFDRLLLTPGSRVPLLVGTVAYSSLRSTIPTTGVLIVSVMGGLSLTGGPLALLTVYVATWGMAAVFCLVGLTVVYKFRTMRSMILIQVFGFSSMFLSTGQVPIHFMNGWLHAVARVNPVTNVLRFSRQGFLGDITWSLTWPGLLALAAMVLVSGVLALRQLGKLAA